MPIYLTKNGNLLTEEDIEFLEKDSDFNFHEVELPQEDHDFRSSSNISCCW